MKERKKIVWMYFMRLDASRDINITPACLPLSLLNFLRKEEEKIRKPKKEILSAFTRIAYGNYRPITCTDTYEKKKPSKLLTHESAPLSII